MNLNIGKFGNSFLEQVSTSFGTFAFYLVTARVVGPHSFGLFATFLVPAQIVYSVAAQWVLLPLTTSIANDIDSLASTAMKRLLALVLSTPPFAIVFALLSGQSSELYLFVIIVTMLAIALMVFDSLRYFAIRMDLIKLQISVNAIRWVVSFAVFLGSQQIPIKHELSIVISLVFGIIAAGFLSLTIIAKHYRFSSNAKPSHHKSTGSEGNSLLSLGITNAIFTLATSAALTRSSVAAFGAIQAFRSLVNWAPLILQYLETHFASKLAREGVSNFIHNKLLFVFVGFGIVGIFTLLAFGDWIIAITVGTQYLEYDWLLTVMFALVLVQSYTRTLGIEARLQSISQIFWHQSILIVLGTFLMGFLMLARPDLLSTVVCITIMCFIAVMQAVSMTIGLKKN